MSSSELLSAIKNLKKSNSKENINENSNTKKNNESPKSKDSSPKENQKNFPFSPERDLETDFSVTFKEIYNIHMTEIESKTNLNRKYIYIILMISFFFFLIGHLQRTLSYLLTGFYPLKWTIQDFKSNKENFGKKWGTYWALFCVFIFFDMHKREVLIIIPWYFIIKTVFLIILYLPGFTAAANLYDGLFKDIILSLSIYFQNKEDDETLLDVAKKNIKIKKE